MNEEVRRLNLEIQGLNAKRGITEKRLGAAEGMKELLTTNVDELMAKRKELREELDGLKGVVDGL